jgi:hypothetical protein
MPRAGARPVRRTVASETPIAFAIGRRERPCETISRTLGRSPAELPTASPCVLKTRFGAFADDPRLELGERTRDVEHRATDRRADVDRLMQADELDPERAEFIELPSEVRDAPRSARGRGCTAASRLGKARALVVYSRKSRRAGDNGHRL